MDGNQSPSGVFVNNFWRIESERNEYWGKTTDFQDRSSESLAVRTSK
jgi:hypothetical protein